MSDVGDDIERLRLPSSLLLESLFAKKQSRSRIKGEFLKGPIPLVWLATASRLRGKAPLAVALAIWFQAGRAKCNEIKLTSAILARFNVNRKAKYRALAALEKAGLIEVERTPRRNPTVRIVQAPLACRNQPSLPAPVDRNDQAQVDVAHSSLGQHDSEAA